MYLILIVLLGLAGYYVYTQQQVKPVTVTIIPTVTPSIEQALEVPMVIKDTTTSEIQNGVNTTIESIYLQSDLDTIVEGTLSTEEAQQNTNIESLNQQQDLNNITESNITPEESQQNVEISSIISSENY
jgi:hypothetical protein